MVKSYMKTEEFFQHWKFFTKEKIRGRWVPEGKLKFPCFDDQVEMYSYCTILKNTKVRRILCKTSYLTRGLSLVAIGLVWIALNFQSVSSESIKTFTLNSCWRGLKFQRYKIFIIPHCAITCFNISKQLVFRFLWRNSNIQLKGNKSLGLR